MSWDINDPKTIEFLKNRKSPKTGESLYDTYMKDILGSKGNHGLPEEKGRRGNTGDRFNTKGGFIDPTGKKWDSKWEYDVYCVLVLLERGGYLSDLELQPDYDMLHNGVLICNSKLDFRFKIKGIQYVADAKSRQTAKVRAWVLIKKMFRAFYSLEVVTFIQEDNNVQEIIFKMLK